MLGEESNVFDAMFPLMNPTSVKWSGKIVCVEMAFSCALILQTSGFKTSNHRVPTKMAMPKGGEKKKGKERKPCLDAH